MNENETLQEQSKPELVSRPNNLKMLKFTVENFAGLNLEESKDGCMVIAFPENERIMEAKGNQGVGKTSLLNAMMASMGLPEPDNAINNKSGNKSSTLEFEQDGRIYKVRITKKGFTLTYNTELNGKQTVSEIKKPKDSLYNIIGPIGVSPDFLREKRSGADQIKWIKSLTIKGEAETKEAEIKAQHKKAYDSRTEKNKDLARLRSEAISAGIYAWDAENFVLQETEKKMQYEEAVSGFKDDVQIREAHDAASKKKANLLAGKTRMEGLLKSKEEATEDIQDFERQIEALQLKIQQKQASIAELNTSIEKGEKFLEENKDAEAEYEKALADMQNAGKIALQKKELEDAAIKVAEFLKVESELEALNNTIEECSQQLKDLAKEYTPDIPGLEVVTNGIDNTRPEGVYLNGTNMAHLSESECWDLCLRLWRMQGTSIVFIENITSLGSEAVERVNWFAQQGGYVFVSMMQRDYKDLVVEFVNEIK